MDPLPNINYIHVQAKINAIIIVIYLINVLYTCVPCKRVDKYSGTLINKILDSGTEHTLMVCFCNEGLDKRVLIEVLNRIHQRKIL